MFYNLNYDKYFRSKKAGSENEMMEEDNWLAFHNDWTLQEIIDDAIANNWLGLNMDLFKFKVQSAEKIWTVDEEGNPISVPAEEKTYNFSERVYRMWISQFYNDRIEQQTIDLHKMRLRAYMERKSDRIISLLRNQMITKLGNSSTNSTGGGTLSRDAVSDLPEDRVDVDVATTSLAYADQFKKSKTSNTGSGGSGASNDRNPNEMVLQDDIFADLLDGAYEAGLFMWIN